LTKRNDDNSTNQRQQQLKYSMPITTDIIQMSKAKGFKVVGWTVGTVAMPQYVVQGHFGRMKITFQF